MLEVETSKGVCYTILSLHDSYKTNKETQFLSLFKDHIIVKKE